VLAAGEGRRFGGTKQLAELDGKPLLQHAVDAANAAPLDRVVVVLGHDAERIGAAVEFGRAETLTNAAWREGQASSLRAGLAAVRAAEAVVVLLGDQPRVTPMAVERVLRARGDAVAVRAVNDGRPGHPVVLEHALFAEVLRLRGDMGARDLLARHRVVEVEMEGATIDVDTAADLR
jgi:molybdenum cofactor cytidylyltransferase